MITNATRQNLRDGEPFAMLSAPLMRLVLGLMATLGLLGCAQNANYQSTPRSIASIGDKTETIVTGEPGSAIASDVPDLPGGNPRDTTISGRVVDERGRPVPKAKVRLAIAGAKGGRAETVKADSSGGFTLHQLKRGTAYVVIAEAVEGDETLVGRAEVKAPQTSLRIRLHSRAESSNAFRTSSNSSRPKVGTMSNISKTEEDEEDSDTFGKPRSFNNEDIDPPAPEAATVRRGRRSAVEEAPADEEATSARNDEDVELELPRESRQRRSRKSQIPATLHPDVSDDPRPSAGFDDDGENPLPPAREPTDSSEAAIRIKDDSDSVGPSVASNGKPADPAPRSGNPSGIPVSKTPAAKGRSLGGKVVGREDPQVVMASTTASLPVTQEVISKPESARPSGDLLLAAPGRELQPDPMPFDQPVSPSTGRSEPAASPATARSESGPGLRNKRGARSTAAVGPATSSGQTWKEIARDQEVPLDESLRKRAIARKSAESTRTETSPKKIPPKSEGMLLSRLFRSQPETPTVPTLCRYDSATRQLHDFQLPDVEGRTISLQDFDSDLILLDFWGTWCAPCRTSIPKLAEFQSRFGKKRLQVIGIACERGPANRRAELVVKAQKDLGINYPVVIASKDGSCPLQEALQIQFYPTMILLDRHGNILWREQGATEATLYRIERAINSTK